MHSQEIVERGTILRATVGSTVHGLHHGGQDDRDETAVFIELPQYLVGLARARGIRGGLYGFEHYVERTQPEGVRSGHGDLDLVAYSLRKYIRLAIEGIRRSCCSCSCPTSSSRSRPRWAGSCAGYGLRCFRAAPGAGTWVTSAASASGSW